MLVTSIFSFSRNVFYPSQKEFLYFKLHLFFLFENPFDLDQSKKNLLDQSKNLSFDKELTRYSGVFESLIITKTDFVSFIGIGLSYMLETIDNA